MTDRNENRPGYKEANVGWIPEGWSDSHLGQVFNKSSEKGRMAHPVLSVTMDRGLIDRSEMDRQMAPDLPPEQSLKVSPGDIVYNMMRMWQGSVGLCETEGLVSSAYVVCKPKQEACPKFFYYLFKSHAGLYRLWAYSYGITGDRLRLYYQDFAKAPAALPSFPEQEAIAEVLGCWDEGLESLEKLIEAKKLRKKGLMQKLLTGEKRLPGFSKDWKEARLGDVFQERKETKHNELPLLAITGNRGIIPADEVNKKDSSNSDKSKYKRICPSDIGYNTMRMWQGVSAVSSLEGIVSPAYTICTPNDSLDVAFIGYLFKTPEVIYRFWSHSQGLVADTLNLKFPNFAHIHINIPATLEEQKAIAAVLETADEEIGLLEAEREALSAQKKGLMQKLLTGEKRLPAFQKSAA